MGSTADELAGILRLIVGLVGVSLIQQGYTLTTQQHSGLISMIVNSIQGISNVLAGFLLVILAIEPKLASRVLEFLLEKLGGKQKDGCRAARARNGK